MGISRERRTWAYAFHACISSMSRKMVCMICKRNKDIFIIRGKEIKFTKEFLDGKKEMDSLFRMRGHNRGI